MPTLAEQAHEAAIAAVKAEKPSQFTVGGSFDGHTLTGGVTVQRSWRNGWAATAYLRGWWNDAPVIPDTHVGAVLGVEAVKTWEP